MNLCVPSGGKAFGLLKAQQEERLDEINKVKGRSKGAGPGGKGPLNQGTYPGSLLSPHSNSWRIPNIAVMRICPLNWKPSRVRGKLKGQRGSEEGGISSRTEKGPERRRVYIRSGKKGGCLRCSPLLQSLSLGCPSSTLSCSLHLNRAPQPHPHFLCLPYLLLPHLPHLALSQWPFSQSPVLPLPGTLQPVLTLSAFSPHPEKYMEFDLNGNGDIGEKRVMGACADPGRGRSLLLCLFLVIWERAQLPE